MRRGGLYLAAKLDRDGNLIYVRTRALYLCLFFLKVSLCRCDFCLSVLDAAIRHASIHLCAYTYPWRYINIRTICSGSRLYVKGATC